jgi:small subunit ribosomal protein S19e
MAEIYEIEPRLLIESVAKDLKKIIKAPEWTKFVKTGVSKERVPVNEDWWYIRAASMMRVLVRLGPVGVSKLRTKYGGKKNRGVRPESVNKASGKIIRTIFQQLEEAKLVKTVEEGLVKKGRVLTKEGKEMLKRAASNL